MNQSCDHHLEVISDSLDEGLPLPEATSEHLETCAECRAFRGAWGNDSGYLADHARFPECPEIPDSLAELVVPATLPDPGFSRRRSIPWFAGIAAVLALVAGLMLWKPAGKAPDTVSIPIPPPDLVDSSPDPSGRIAVSLKIPAYDSRALEARLKAAVAAEAVSLAENGHRLGRLAANLRRQTAVLSEFSPNGN